MTGPRVPLDKQRLSAEAKAKEIKGPLYPYLANPMEAVRDAAELVGHPIREIKRTPANQAQHDREDTKDTIPFKMKVETKERNRDAKQASATPEPSNSGSAFSRSRDR